jgi:hypothetical protein
MAYSSDEVDEVAHVTYEGTRIREIVLRKGNGDLLPVPVGPPKSIIVTKGDASISVVNTSAAWVDSDPGGNAAARPLDLVVPNVRAGDWIEVEPLLLADNTAGFVRLRFATIVAGALVNTVPSGEAPPGCWALLSSVYDKAVGALSYQLQAGDIENGSVRLRLQHVSTNTRTLFASTPYTLRLEARGPFV